MIKKSKNFKFISVITFVATIFTFVPTQQVHAKKRTPHKITSTNIFVATPIITLGSALIGYISYKNHVGEPITRKEFRNDLKTLKQVCRALGHKCTPFKKKTKGLYNDTFIIRENKLLTAFILAEIVGVSLLVAWGFVKVRSENQPKIESDPQPPSDQGLDGDTPGNTEETEPEPGPGIVADPDQTPSEPEQEITRVVSPTPEDGEGSPEPGTELVESPRVVAEDDTEFTSLLQTADTLLEEEISNLDGMDAKRLGQEVGAHSKCLRGLRKKQTEMQRLVLKRLRESKKGDTSDIDNALELVPTIESITGRIEKLDKQYQTLNQKRPIRGFLKRRRAKKLAKQDRTSKK